MSDRDEIELQIPRLRNAEYRITSERDVRYNCFAWAGGDDSRVWSPIILGSGVYWPPGIPALPSLSGVIDAYSIHGYETCDSGELEAGYEKVAIFTDAIGEPRHAARQLSSGAWTSKLGDHVDIEHEVVDAVAGAFYGAPTTFMRRALEPASPNTAARSS